MYVSVEKFFQCYDKRYDLFINNTSYLLGKSLIIIRGGPEKNRTAYFPQYVEAITGISVWGKFSWEKWYQVELG